jgi:hypothetical protein
MAENTLPLGEHGTNQHTVAVAKMAEHTVPLGEDGGKRGFDNINPSLEGGTSAAYLTAKIARDHPDILERMKTGEFPSVRKAGSSTERSSTSAKGIHSANAPSPLPAPQCDPAGLTSVLPTPPAPAP